jgi:hypothetical protein
MLAVGHFQDVIEPAPSDADALLPGSFFAP